jgi:hypothetical protein
MRSTHQAGTSTNHHANYTYNYNDGFNWTESDSDDNEYHYYERGAERKSHTGALLELDRAVLDRVRVSALDLDNRQISRAAGIGRWVRP